MSGLNDWFEYVPKAERLRSLNGKKLYRIPTTVEYVDVQSRDFTPTRVQQYVTAASPKDAIEWVMQALEGIPNITVCAYGPRGGKTKRFRGYERTIAEQIMSEALA